MKDLITSAKDMKLSKFLEAINIAGLDKEMKSGKVTVFAPVDDAFEEMSELMMPNAEIAFQVHNKKYDIKIYIDKCHVRLFRQSFYLLT
jgi:uncharacterized surface protein with fasciclin (FAS1) repeats